MTGDRCGTDTPVCALSLRGTGSSNHSLRRRNVTPYHCLRLPQRDRERLEDRLGCVMSVAAANEIYVDVAGTFVRERLEKLFDERERKVFVDQQHLAVDRNFENEVWTPGEVDHDACQRLVERDVGMTESAETRLVAQRLREGFAPDEGG